jgi:hypothetical protein
VQLRLVLRDHHRSRIVSSPLATSVAELQIERTV